MLYNRRKSFRLQGKRKRKITDLLNASSLSNVNSPLNESLFSSAGFDMSAAGPTMADVAPEVKRKRSLSRMTSAISTPMAKMSSVLQRSLSSARLHGCPSPQKGTPTRYKYINHISRETLIKTVFSYSLQKS